MVVFVLEVADIVDMSEFVVGLDKSVFVGVDMLVVARLSELSEVFVGGAGLELRHL